jgi:hypothetical protein
LGEKSPVDGSPAGPMSGATCRNVDEQAHAQALAAMGYHNLDCAMPHCG